VVYLLVSINFPIYLLIIIVSKEILELLYGTNYVSGYLVLSFLAISYVTNTLSNPVGSLQIATGRTDIGFKWTLIRVMIVPAVIYFSAKGSINIVAGAIAILSIALLFPLWWVQLKPMANIQLLEYLQQFWKPYALLLLITGLYLGISQYYELPFGLITNVILKFSISMFLYFGLIWIIDKKRIIQLKEIITSLSRTLN
jgi:O-antigen/teichoic acid export membrane protein